MKVTIISNGTTQMVFTPETAIDKDAIKEFKGRTLNTKVFD